MSNFFINFALYSGLELKNPPKQRNKSNVRYDKNNFSRR